MMAVAVKRHLITLLLGLFVLCALLFIGAFLATHFNGTIYTDSIPGVNNGYLVAWRVMVYGLLVGCWQHIVHLAARLRGASPDRSGQVRYRKHIAALCFGFELLVVQNALGTVMTLLVTGG